MNTFYIVLAVVLALTNGETVNADDTLGVQVYYEAMNPASKEFITQQLYPTFVQLGRERIKLEMIPYGHATEVDGKNGQKNFTCENGPDECYANKVQACMTHLSFTAEETLYFIYCSELSDTPANNTVLEVCAKGVGMPWLMIELCLNTAAEMHLAANGAKTALVDASILPTVVFNGDYYPPRKSVLNNFKETVCQFINCIY